MVSKGNQEKSEYFVLLHIFEADEITRSKYNFNTGRENFQAKVLMLCECAGQITWVVWKICRTEYEHVRGEPI